MNSELEWTVHCKGKKSVFRPIRDLMFCVRSHCGKIAYTLQVNNKLPVRGLFQADRYRYFIRGAEDRGIWILGDCISSYGDIEHILTIRSDNRAHTIHMYGCRSDRHGELVSYVVRSLSPEIEPLLEPEK